MEKQPDQVSDEALFELLNRYTEALPADRETRRRELVAEHPALGELLDCLDALDSMAPPPAGAAETPTDAVDRTAKTMAFPEPAAADSTASGPASPTADGPRPFGKYQLLGEIGRGGMGVVYHARQEDLDRSVALKMILASHLASDAEVRRFYDEARAAGGLQHQNIVAIHEVGQINGQHYFTMDFVAGRSLEDVLAAGALEPEAAARYLATIARAVDYLHGHGIVHRDLKPSNILIDAEGTPYVADFGLCKVFSADSQRTATGMIVGTPLYMSPEQAAGQKDEVSQKSDIYSLGALLYAMLTGHAPVGEGNLLDMLIEVREGEPLPPCRLDPRIPRRLERICLCCMAKKPADRYPTAAALAEDLDRFLKGEAVTAQGFGLCQCLRRWARRQPVLASHLGGLLVATGIIQANYQVRGVDLHYHLKIMSLFAIWAVVAVAFHRILAEPRTATIARFAWTAADVILLTTILFLAYEPIGPLLIGYPLLIVAVGLFFRVSLVWFMTGVALLSFAALAILRPELRDQPHYPVIFAGVLAVVGFIVAHQVRRVHALTHYCEAHRR
jgi:hypothetical protein